MDVPQSTSTPYTTSARVQAWFLGRSRARWKQKYKDLKVAAKRLQNRVNDVTKSREQWRDEAQQLRRRVRELETENSTLRTQALKKEGLPAGEFGRR